MQGRSHNETDSDKKNANKATLLDPSVIRTPIICVTALIALMILAILVAWKKIQHPKRPSDNVTLQASANPNMAQSFAWLREKWYNTTQFATPGHKPATNKPEAATKKGESSQATIAKPLPVLFQNPDAKDGSTPKLEGGSTS